MMDDVCMIKIDQRIYPIEIILRAIEGYRSLADITYKFHKDNQKVFISFENFEIDVEKIKDEFCNYLIELISTNNQGA